MLDALDEEDIADWLRTLTSSNGPTTWLVESADGEILAFSRHGEDPLDSRRGHIYSLYVAPEAPAAASAKALLDHDLRLLSERGLGTVTLWVFEQNRAARNLYASFGFVPDGARRVEPEYGAQEIRLRRPGEHKPDGHKPDEHRPEEHTAHAPRPAENGPEEHTAHEHRPDEHRPDEHRPDEHRPDEHRPDEHGPDEHRPGAGGG